MQSLHCKYYRKQHAEWSLSVLVQADVLCQVYGAAAQERVVTACPLRACMHAAVIKQLGLSGGNAENTDVTTAGVVREAATCRRAFGGFVCWESSESITPSNSFAIACWIW